MLELLAFKGLHRKEHIDTVRIGMLVLIGPVANDDSALQGIQCHF